MAIRALGAKRFARSAHTRLLAVVLVAVAGAAHAEWVTVAKDREREVQLDLQTVIPAEAGVKVAWGRVLLAPDEAARLGFAAVRALNRFDCQKRTFTTVKRVYLDSDGVPLRDEAIAQPEPAPVVKGSVDERLWRAVCQPTSSQALQQLAQEALASTRSAMEPGGNGKAAAPSSPPPSAASSGKLPIGVDLADPNQLPPELAQQPVPNLLPVKPTVVGKPPTPAPTNPASASERATPPPTAPQPAPAPRQEAAARPKTATATTPAPTPLPPSAAKRPAPPVSGAKTETAEAKASTEAPSVAKKPPRQQPPRQLAAATRTPAATQKPPVATWQFTGANGPENWHRLDPTWKLCRSGKRQSPITVTDPVPAALTPPLWLTEPHPVRVDRTPQGVIVLEPQVVQRLWWRERLWELERATWHHPVLHPGRAGNYLGSWVVQWSSGGERLFIELPVAASPRTAPELLRLADYLITGRTGALRWDWRALLPGEERFWVYEGSEPWPPCREGVTWLLYAEGGEADPAAVAPLVQGSQTVRPVQPGNGRLVFAGER